MNKDKGLEAELELVRKELEVWRGSSPKGHRMPETVWSEAVRIARMHGINPVSKALNLDYSCLKKRVDGIKDCRKRGMGLMPAFMELRPEISQTDSGCVVELEKGNGTRLRICAKASGALDWSKIKEVFLGA